MRVKELKNIRSIEMFDFCPWIRWDKEPFESNRSLWEVISKSVEGTLVCDYSDLSQCQLLQHISDELKRSKIDFVDASLNDLYNLYVEFDVSYIWFTDFAGLSISCSCIEITAHDSAELESFIGKVEAWSQPDAIADLHLKTVVEKYCKNNTYLKYNNNIWCEILCPSAHVLRSEITIFGDRLENLPLGDIINTCISKYSSKITPEITIKELTEIRDQIVRDVYDIAVKLVIDRLNTVKSEVIPHIVNTYESILNEFLKWLDEKSKNF